MFFNVTEFCICVGACIAIALRPIVAIVTSVAANKRTIRGGWVGFITSRGTGTLGNCQGQISHSLSKIPYKSDAQPCDSGEFAVPSFPPRLCWRFLAKLLPTRVSAGRILFWRERIDDRLKARLAPERIPKRRQLQIPVADVAARQVRCLG